MTQLESPHSQKQSYAETVLTYQIYTFGSKIYPFGAFRIRAESVNYVSRRL